MVWGMDWSFFLCTWMSDCSSPICQKAFPFSTELPLYFCLKSTDYMFWFLSGLSCHVHTGQDKVWLFQLVKTQRATLKFRPFITYRSSEERNSQRCQLFFPHIRKDNTEMKGARWLAVWVVGYPVAEQPTIDLSWMVLESAAPLWGGKAGSLKPHQNPKDDEKLSW